MNTHALGTRLVAVAVILFFDNFLSDHIVRVSAKAPTVQARLKCILPTDITIVAWFLRLSVIIFLSIDFCNFVLFIHSAFVYM